MADRTHENEGEVFKKKRQKFLQNSNLVTFRLLSKGRIVKKNLLILKI